MNLQRIKEKRIAELKNNVREYICLHYDWLVIRQIAENKPIPEKAKTMRFHALKFCTDKETKINSAANILEVMAVEINLK